jgi:hypothetical protein
MKLTVLLDESDPKELHETFEKAFIQTEGGWEGPIEISGKFIFGNNFSTNTLVKRRAIVDEWNTDVTRPTINTEFVLYSDSKLKIKWKKGPK